jgi:hypothetical protein
LVNTNILYVFWMLSMPFWAPEGCSARTRPARRDDRASRLPTTINDRPARWGMCPAHPVPATGNTYQSSSFKPRNYVLYSVGIVLVRLLIHSILQVYYRCARDVPEGYSQAQVPPHVLYHSTLYAEMYRRHTIDVPHTKDVPETYQRCTGDVPEMYRRCTRDVPETYRRGSSSCSIML